MNASHISVCVCTFGRPSLLAECLKSLLNQECRVEFEIIVVDNDKTRSAKPVTIAFAGSHRIQYAYEPSQGISTARNYAVSLAKGNMVAFIDDDETASSGWLQTLYDTLVQYHAEGVVGPVIPTFPQSFPRWQEALFVRKRFQTGCLMTSKTVASGNCLLSRDLLLSRSGPFDIELNRIGGEDVDLFGWLKGRGARFVWCDEAVVYEMQTLDRSEISWHVRRTYRGGWTFSRQMAMRHGPRTAFLIALAWIVPAGFVSCIKSILHFDIRTILLAWLRIGATQFGKLGYFLHWDVENYPVRPGVSR